MKMDKDQINFYRKSIKKKPWYTLEKFYYKWETRFSHYALNISGFLEFISSYVDDSIEVVSDENEIYEITFYSHETKIDHTKRNELKVSILSYLQHLKWEYAWDFFKKIKEQDEIKSNKRISNKDIKKIITKLRKREYLYERWIDKNNEIKESYTLILR